MLHFAAFWILASVPELVPGAAAFDKAHIPQLQYGNAGKVASFRLNSHIFIST